MLLGSALSGGGFGAGRLGAAALAPSPAALMQSLGVGYVGADALAAVGPLGGGANGLPSVSSCLSE